jgi:hypothetical protein
MTITAPCNKMSVTFRLYPSARLMRRALSTLMPDTPIDKDVRSYHIGGGRQSHIYLSKYGGAWYRDAMHECIHAADYLCKFRPRGVRATEFRAYFSEAIFKSMLRWGVARFPDVETLDFKLEMGLLAQSIDPEYSKNTTQ